MFNDRNILHSMHLRVLPGMESYHADLHFSVFFFTLTTYKLTIHELKITQFM